VEHSKIPGYRKALDRGYRLEESYRDYSYLDAPEFICGIELRPLSLQMFWQLSAARSPFLVGGRHPFFQDVGVFLFRLSPAYDAAFAAKAQARAKVARARTMSRRELLRIARENALPLLIPFGRGRLDVGRCRWLSPLLRRASLIGLLEQNVEAIAMAAYQYERMRFLRAIRSVPFAAARRAIRRFVDRMLLDQPPRTKNKNPSLDLSDTSAVEDIIHIIAGARGWSRAEILRMPMPEVFQAIRNIRRDDPKCAKRHRARVHPFAVRFTRKHRKIAEAAAFAEAGLPTPPDATLQASTIQRSRHAPQ
jgi:hypothetical protein